MKIRKTDPDVLIGNLRGEVGEAITNWIIVRRLTASARRMQTDDVAEDMRNDDLALIYAIKERISNDLVLTLVELSELKIGRATFYFASEKLSALQDDVREFRRFIVVHKLKEKRNREIAHREQPEEWPQKGGLRVGYVVLTVALAKAIRLMKKIDFEVMGEDAYLRWHEMRKKRYDLTMPARAKYLLLPYMAK